MVLSKGMAVEVMIHLALIHGRTGARVPAQLPPRTKPVKSRAKGKCARLPSSPTPTGALTSPAARCSRFPGLCPCFAAAPFTCGICLYPAVTAVAFYSRMNNDAHRYRLRVGREVARLGSAPHANYESGSNLANASRCAHCTAADLRCKRLVGRTGTPCSHFSPGAAPPLSLGCVQPGLTAPPTRR